MCVAKERCDHRADQSIPRQSDPSREKEDQGAKKDPQRSRPRRSGWGGAQEKEGEKGQEGRRRGWSGGGGGGGCGRGCQAREEDQKGEESEEQEGEWREGCGGSWGGAGARGRVCEGQEGEEGQGDAEGQWDGWDEAAEAKYSREEGGQGEEEWGGCVARGRGACRSGSGQRKEVFEERWCCEWGDFLFFLKLLVYCEVANFTFYMFVRRSVCDIDIN